MDTIFISWGGGNTWPQTWWLKTAPVHSLPPLEPRVEPHPLKSPSTAPLTPARSWGTCLPIWLVFTQPCSVCLLPSFIRTSLWDLDPSWPPQLKSLNLITSAKRVAPNEVIFTVFRTGTYFGENHPSSHCRCWCLNICQWRQDLSAPTPYLTVTTGKLWVSSILQRSFGK